MPKKQRLENSYLLYHGPSLITNSGEVIAVLTGMIFSENEKTGNIPQVYIFNADISPGDSIRSYQDLHVCGWCPFRSVFGSRVCYVNVKNIHRMYGAFQRGRYQYLENKKLIKNKTIRIGAYGDPAAVPQYVWNDLKEHSAHLLSYTHMWQDPRFSYLKEYSMASVETLETWSLAKQAGWRTYRATLEGCPALHNEIFCPFPSRGIQCCDCGLCSGWLRKAKDVVSPVHGLPRAMKAFEERFLEGQSLPV